MEPKNKNPRYKQKQSRAMIFRVGGTIEFAAVDIRFVGHEIKYKFHDPSIKLNDGDRLKLPSGLFFEWE